MKNEKGFTLIEIIVSLAIGSIALFVAGSVLVNTFRLFGVYSDTTLRKRSLDNVVEYFRKELEYSTDAWYVESFDKIPKKLHSGDKWRCMYVEDGRLYWTNDATKQAKQLFSDGFYNGKENKLSISFTNVIRTSGHTPHNFINLYYSLFNSNEKYDKEDTIHMSNLNETLTDDLSVDANLQYHTFTSKQSLSSKKLFYRSTNYSSLETIEDVNPTPTPTPTPDPGDVTPTYTYTVKDKLYLMTPYLNMGYYEPEESHSADFNDNYPIQSIYRAGDYVFYKGYWYILLESTDNNVAPDNPNSCWEKLDENYDNNSGYVKGDIVRGRDGQYYKWTGDWNWHNKGIDPVSFTNKNSTQWNVLTTQTLSKVAKTINDSKDAASINFGQFIKYNNRYYQRTPLEASNDDVSYIGAWSLYWREAEQMPTANSNIYNEHMFLDNNEENGNRRMSIEAPTNSLILQRKNKYKLNYPTYETQFNGIEEYDKLKDMQDVYKIGSVVKVKIYNGGGNNHDYYQLYVKIFTDYYKSGTTHEPGNKNHDEHSHGLLSGWKLLENEYQPYSSYEQGDWVRTGMRNNEADGIHDYRICFGGDMYNTYSSLTLASKSTCSINEHLYMSGYGEQDIVNQFILQENTEWVNGKKLECRDSIWKKPN
ncbi:PulJ/GspJ family protein [Kandleria vitulina]|uniref:PulJ/GspJ family protein n=1 Tax=Kandleria vitulina TaxID=1630 RepID=UPI0004901837|nr:prepilin-type N-terminal cleavage/methylation domain-containing protein [Kandleria vitulina]